MQGAAHSLKCGPKDFAPSEIAQLAIVGFVLPRFAEVTARLML